MKTVFANHAEVCHIWAQQKQFEGRASRIFFRDKSIFSYGDHFEAARFVLPNVVFITTRKHSVSTGKHVTLISRAVSHIRSFTVPSFDSHDVNVRYYLKEMADEAMKAAKAVKHGEFYLEQMSRTCGELDIYLGLFGKKIPASLRNDTIKQIKLIKAKKFDDIIERSRKAVRVEREEAKAKRLEEEKEAAERIEKWKAGENVGYLPSAIPFLRIKGNEIETSMGARVPTDLALAMYHRLKRGAPVHGVTLGMYTVTSFDGGILTVGCHKIPLSEMDRIAAQLNGGQ